MTELKKCCGMCKFYIPNFGGGPDDICAYTPSPYITPYLNIRIQSTDGVDCLTWEKKDD